MMDDKVYGKEFYGQQAGGSLASARSVLPILFESYLPSDIVDVGCGVGTWLKAAMELGVQRVLGLDGDYVDRGLLLIPPSAFQAVDLSRPLQADSRFDLAISLEVAEHLPYERSQGFVEDLVALSEVVLFSAALPYQGGSRHINEQWLEFWALLFRTHRYVPVDLLRDKLWKNSAVEFWYSQNLMIFCREDFARKFPPEALAVGRVLSRPHPLTFLANVARYRPFSALALDAEMNDWERLTAAYLSGQPLPAELRAPQATDAAGLRLFPETRTRVLDADEELAARDREIGELREALSAAGERLGSCREELQGIRTSFSWKLTRPLREISKRFRRRPALQERECRLLRKSKLFDPDYYLATNPDVAEKKMDPALHYLLHGAAEGRNPSSRFHTRFYLESNPDVARSGMNPLLHYVLYGAAEGRRYRPHSMDHP